MLYHNVFSQTWTVQDPQFSVPAGSSADKADIRTLDNVWAYTTGSQFSRTQNGGSTWNAGFFTQINAFYNGAPYSIDGFSGLDNNTAWVMTYAYTATVNYATIWKTIDGGSTWISQLNGLPNRAGNFVHFFDANIGVAVIGKEFLYNTYNYYRTTNGGTTWSLLPTTSSPTVAGNPDQNDIIVVDNTMFIFEKNFSTNVQKIIKSSDQGLTWSRLPATVGGTDRNVMTWSTAMKGFMVEQSFTNTNVMVMKKTVDGGNTWSTVSYSGITTPYLTDIAYVPGTDILIGTGGPNFVSSWISNNGGNTWTNIDNSNATPHFSVDCASANNVGVCYSVGYSQALNKRVVYKMLFPSLSVGDVTPKWEGIYPNPTRDEINIKTEKKIKFSTLYDVSGKIVLKADKKRIDVSSIAKGIYILKVQFDNGSEVSEKIIKE